MYRKAFNIILRILLWIFSFVVILLIVLLLVFQVPRFQNFLASKAVGIIEKQLDTKIELERIGIVLPNSVSLEKFTIDGTDNDTLLHFDRLSVNADVFRFLFKKELVINSVTLVDAKAKIVKYHDSAFNFQFVQAEGNNKKKENETGGIKRIGVEDINLHNIRIIYTDSISGNTMQGNIGSLNVKINFSDITNQVFDVNSVSLKNSDISVLIEQKDTTESNSGPVNLDFKLKKNVLIKNTSINYEDNVLSQKIKLNGGEILLRPDEINIVSKRIGLNSLQIENTTVNYEKGNLVATENTVIQENDSLDNGSIPEWKIWADKLELSGNHVIYNDNSKPETRGIDFNHLDVNNIELVITDILAENNEYSASITSFYFIEKSGFLLNNLIADVYVNKTKAVLEGFSLVTPNSEINNATSVFFSSLDEIKNSPEEVLVNVNFKNTKIGFADILYFQPSLDEKIHFSQNNLFIDGKVQGKLNSLDIENIALKYGETTVVAQGTVKGLPKIENSQSDLNINAKIQNSSQITSILSDSLIPPSIVIPNRINVEAKFKGNPSLFQTNAEISSDQGKIAANINFQEKANLNNIKSDFNIKWHLGQLLGKEDTIGLIDLAGNFSGSMGESINPIMDFDVDIKNLTALNYTYHNLKANGKLENNNFNGDVTLNDKNISFLINLSAEIDKELKSLQAFLNVKAADLRALQLTKDDLRLRGIINADIKGFDPEEMNGNIMFSDFLFLKDNKRHYIDEFTIDARNEDSITKIKINSAFLNAEYTGSLPVTEIPVSLKKYINNYITLQDVKTDSSNDAYFDFTANFNNTEVFSEILVPGLKSFASSEVSARFNENNGTFNLEVSVPEVLYNNLGINSFLFNINSNKNNLQYTATVDRISNNNLLIKNTSIQGTIQEDSLFVVLSMKDSLKQEQYHIESFIRNEESGYLLSFIPGDFLLNYEYWLIAENNYVLFTKDGLSFNNLRIEKEEKRFLALTPTGSSATGPIQVEFSGLLLQDILSSVQSQQNLLSGILNGKLELLKENDNFYFSSDLNIDKLSIFQNQLFENISIKANKTGSNTITLASVFSGSSNNFKINGKYIADKENSSITINSDISSIDLATFQPLLKSQFNTIEGNLKGEINISGMISNPEVNGEINLHDVLINPVALNSNYLIDDEVIIFDGKRVVLNDFTVTDNQENNADFNGFVQYGENGLISFDLNANAKDFYLLNTKEDPDKQFYGKIIADLTADITGNTKKPVVDVQTVIKEGSEFHYTVINNRDVTIEKEGIVEFVQKDTLVSDILEKDDSMQITGINTPVELDISAEIEIKDNALLQVIIDPSTNENLTIRGEGNLGFSLKPPNVVNLTGRYEINEGSYTLSFYNVIKREFEIDKGSYLNWSGDPLGAMADISAIYRVRTSPMGLINDQVQQMSTTERQRYGSNSEFMVYLNIKGELLSPEIDFDIRTPEEERNILVENRLNQLNQNESELNKQVFSLLLFKNFIGGQSAKPVSYEINETARNGISNILSQQLNSFADQYIKGFDVSFDLTSYAGDNTDSYSGNTELEVDVSKRFFNDRLSVQVGGNVGIEGSDNEPGDDMNGITADLVIEYNLTSDGVYKLQGFDKSEYEDLLYGRVRKTGIAFIFNKDFFSFKNIFARKKEKEKEMAYE